jgi:enoyl-CoA hydratase
LGLPETSLGIFAGAGAIHRLVRALGQGVARDLLLSAEPISGSQALQWGLISRLTVQPLAEALRLAERVAAFSPEAVAATKQLAFHASTDDFVDGLDLEQARWMQVRRGSNAQEGLESFCGKRPPVFRRPS